MIDILKYFLFLGSTGFGGPLSLIQQMRQHFVERTQQMTGAEFDQAFTLVKAMPGPIAFQMAVFCGQKLHGPIAGFLAGFGIVFPAFLMMIAMGYSYDLFRQNFYILKLLNGFQFAVAAVILLGLKNFFNQYYRKFVFWCLIAAAAILFYFNIIPEPMIIVGFGLIVVLSIHARPHKAVFMSAPGILVVPELWDIFKVCFYGGAVVFGTGLALIPLLQNQFVIQNHWIDLQTFNDGVTFGQMTPGPVTITAAFLGFKMAGIGGAAVAALGVFLMPLFHMLTWFPHVLNWLSKQKWIPEFLMGATAAVVGVLLITIYKMNSPFYHMPAFWIIFIGSFIYLLRKPKTSILWVIGAGGLANLLVALATNNSI